MKPLTEYFTATSQYRGMDYSITETDNGYRLTIYTGLSMNGTKKSGNICQLSSLQLFA